MASLTPWVFKVILNYTLFRSCFSGTFDNISRHWILYWFYLYISTFTGMHVAFFTVTLETGKLKVRFIDAGSDN